ncbi:MAG: hypothetical protein JXQ90_10425 [Cyclobacteriaceae bacterium]
MEEIEAEKKRFSNDIKSYMDILGYSFEDLFSLSKHDREVFKELYYNRDTEVINFRDLAGILPNTGENILVLGKAGVGKSNFIYRIFFDDSIMEEFKLHPLMVDYREVNPRSVNGCCLTFIDDIKSYFSELKVPVNGLETNNEQNITTNLNIIQRHIKNLKSDQVKKHLVIFLDDLDYLEEEHLFELLEIFSPFAQSPKISLITSARPTLYTSINNNDFKYSHLYTRNVKKIELGPLNINNLISKRLAPILIFEQAHPFHSFIKNLFSKRSAFQKVLSKFGIKDLEQLQKFEYPFTNDFVNFMGQLTNGNLREIFDIAFDALIYILNNYDELENINEVEHGVSIKKKKISKKQIIELYYSNDDSKFKLINLHQRTKNGNSLLFNVLEAIKIFESIDDRFYASLQNLGHKQDEVNEAIEHLKIKKHRLIIPKQIYQPKIKKVVAFCPEYTVTDKGDFYLTEITKWEEYVEKCGESKESLIQKINQSF